ncbi:YgaP family membrane protein [Amphritea sp. HPY]|uniref:YgaP family membrane protein n=1 Tax=Amphritea sp. HPY TaxID=3421652 RepID=UPI003D7CF945
MTVNAALRLMAGSVILLSLALGTYVNPAWYYLTGFVGLNLLQSGFTKWCPAVSVFRMLKLSEKSCVTGMSVHQGVHIIAGTMVLATVAAYLFLSAPQWILYLTAAFGLSLLQSAFSGWCPAFTIASLLGFKKPA